MTRDDIIRMAREAGFPFNKYGLLHGDEEGEIDADEMFERFAALVRARDEALLRDALEALNGLWDTCDTGNEVNAVKKAHVVRAALRMRLEVWE